MKRWVALTSVLVLFVVGVAVGALGTHLYYTQELRRPGGPDAFRADRFLERLEHELELTPDQLGEIDEILRASRREADALHRELLPRVRAQMEGTKERILAVLTSDQQEKFEELHRQHRRRAEQFFLGHGGPRHHGRRPPPDHPPGNGPHPGPSR